MSVRASAPGKLVLAGEYAVLEGAPALVLAVDRRAQVTLVPAADNTYVIDAPAIGVHCAVGHLDRHSRLLMDDRDIADSKSLAVAVAVIESLAAAGPLPGCRLHLDTRTFFSAADGHRKFGFGSSAALTVALGGALHVHAGLGTPSATSLIAAHRRAQDGRGSGLDIAASLTGGMIEYQLRDGQSRIRSVRWPDGLAFCCAWSRQAASTGVFLRGLAEWRQASPVRYAAMMRELATCAEAAASAVVDGCIATVLEVINAYAAALARLGAASGLDIVSAEHRTLARIAIACGVAYKPCGAGGGDVGIALTSDADRLHAFRRRVVEAGLHTLDLQLEPGGLQTN